MTRRELLALLATLPWVAGCGSALGDGRVPLRLAHWGGAGADGEFDRLVRRLRQEFEAANPDLDLRPEGIPGSQEYVSKLLLSHVAGAMPDVVTLDASSAAAFIENGTLRDLAPFAEKDPAFDWGEYFPNVVDVARRGDRVYAVPIDFTPMVVYLNRRLFREAGAALPEPGWDFDRFLAAARATTRGDVFGFEFANWMPGWVMFLWNNGGDVLTSDGLRASGALDSEECVGAVQFLADLVLRHRVAPSLSQVAAMGVDLFATGRAAMKVSGHWNLIALQASPGIDLDDVMVLELPTNLARGVTVMYQAGLAIGASCRHPDAAWRYVRWFTGRNVQERYNASGIAVSARVDVEDAKLQAVRGGSAAAEQRTETFRRVVPTARPPWGARVEGYDIVEREGQGAMDAVLKNGVPVREALQAAAARIDAAVARR